MLLRVRSPDAVIRVDVGASPGPEEVFRKIAESIKIPVGQFVLTLDPGYSQVISPVGAPLNLRHGDMVYVKYLKKDDAATSSQSATAAPPYDPLDALMEKQKGLIPRSKNANFCRHGDSGMCDYCMPLEPYDATYLETNKIKHMSYHAYLRQVTTLSKTGNPNSSNFIPPLDEPSFKVLVPCPSKTHNPFPLGICTKCQPSSITLQTQPFRMVDHVEFESAATVENFIHFWRQTGYQRFGLMFGRFEQYAEVPLGIKAVVSAIYEPPQDCAPDIIQLQLPDTMEEQAFKAARAVGLELVGVIYTDLIDDGTGTGNVICKRHQNSYFFSSAECIFSAQMQDKFPHRTRYSGTSRFGSRLVTCVISGNLESQIDISCYQVSNVGVALARDEIIEASTDPSLLRVRSSTEEHYVPEVFYKYKNEYGLMVQEAAKPTFPVEYLLVTLSHGFPQEPKPLFAAGASFPVEHRGGMDIQNMAAVKRCLSGANIGDALSDFHLLLYLRSVGILEETDLDFMSNIVRFKKDSDVVELMYSPGWQTLQAILSETDAMETTSSSGGPSAKHSAPWTCRHCTYVNLGGESCDVCGLPNE
ncbi:nuclear protein localization protein 4 [Dinochytrium kinnereticum]|nr:nuclear protein localization protein 4 [Dinochytrium kinnereticum]